MKGLADGDLGETDVEIVKTGRLTLFCLIMEIDDLR